MSLNDIHTVYMVGIGGIGMSALARYFQARGQAVHGYDRTETPLTRALVAEGMSIHYQENVGAIPEQVDLVIYTPAIPSDHAELQYFRERGMRLYKRAEILGLISHHQRTIAIAGTHGKTTTSSLTAHLLHTAGLAPTAFLGGVATNFGSNFLAGKSDWVVVEADEFDRSFLHLQPELMVITSTDADHLDIYGDADSMLESGFRAFAKKLKSDGHKWVQKDQVDALAVPGGSTYGLTAGDCRADRIRVAGGQFVFDYTDQAGTLPSLSLPLPGRHNVENAVAAIAIARYLGVEDQDIREGLASFAGIQRRFERIYQDDDLVFYDDYAHHPSELRAAIGAARELHPGKRITGIFQPHLYSRTQDFASGFAEALDQLDELILLEIYPAREKPIPGVSAAMIRSLMQNDRVQLARREDLPGILAEYRPEVLLTLGAGDISERVQPIRTFFNRRKAGV